MKFRRLLIGFFFSLPAAAEYSIVLIRTDVPGDGFIRSLTREQSCSGAILKNDGGLWLVTAAHCVKGDAGHPHRIFVQGRTLLNGAYVRREAKAEIPRHQFFTHRHQDFAVAAYAGPAPSRIASPGPRPKFGDRLWLISYPKGAGPVITACLATGRTLQRQPFSKVLDVRDSMLCDRSAKRGSSGGPVYNDDGEVVAVTSTGMDLNDGVKVGYVPLSDFTWNLNDGLKFKYAGQILKVEDHIDLGDGSKRHQLELRFDDSGVPVLYYFPEK